MLLGCLCTEYVKSWSGWRMSWKIETGKNIVTSLAESVVLERLCRIWRLGWTPIDINKPSKTHVLESCSSQLGLLLRRDGSYRKALRNENLGGWEGDSLNSTSKRINPINNQSCCVQVSLSLREINETSIMMIAFPIRSLDRHYLNWCKVTEVGVLRSLMGSKGVHCLSRRLVFMLCSQQVRSKFTTYHKRGKPFYWNWIDV